MLTRNISAAFAGREIQIDIVAVDDGSFTHFEPEKLVLPEHGVALNVEVLRLAVNVGHQRAIALGLREIAERGDQTHVIVMDGDGEDRPEDLPSLLAASSAAPASIVLAQRGTRSEGPLFRAFYVLYKSMFVLLTGRRIDFGNFSLLPIAAVQRLVRMPELWNHFAATIARSRLPIVKLRVTRGTRYAGQSHMNFNSLVVHGLSAISIFSDSVYVRVMVASSALLGLLGLGMSGVIGIRLFTTLAIPGWTTSAIGFLAVLFMQTILLMSLTLFSLSRRSDGVPPSMPDSRGHIADRSRDSFSSKAAGPAI